MAQVKTETLHQAINQLDPADMGQVLDFIGYLNSRRKIKAKSAKTEEERQAAITKALRTLQESRTFAHITDPVAWQREQRKDRPLPGREG